MPWAVVSFFIIGSSYLLVTATTSKDTIEALSTFVLDFVLVLIFWKKDNSSVKKFLERF